ncbi:MAG: hypothetical protein JSV38_06325 [Desulfobacterales bacterium]|nr:MAG: hypothetical protein JSV38_06325 [Desulfobacterales bacterium]
MLFLTISCGGNKNDQTTGGNIKVGESFSSLSVLNDRQNDNGLVSIGKFGDAWPGKVTQIKESENEIKFTLAKGAVHKYPGYDGYKLVMVRLESESGEEVAVVYRSKEKN